MAPQAANYKRVKQRIRRSLNYGGKAPRSLHLPLTEMMVEYFNQTSPFDYLKPETSASISSCGFADTCTLVVAMCYLERLRQKEKDTFEATNPAEMYLPALVLASKYLHDSDQEERVADEDWAEMSGLTKKELAKMEWDFVKAIDWDVGVDEEEFERRLAMVESWVATDFLSKYSFGTYNELSTISSNQSEKLSEALRLLISAMGLSIMIYSVAVASLLTLPLAFPSTSKDAINTTIPAIRHAALLDEMPTYSTRTDSPSSSESIPCVPLPTVSYPFLLFHNESIDIPSSQSLPSFLSHILSPSSLVFT